MLLLIGSIVDFEQHSLCNFEYLESILSVTNLAHLLSVFEDALTQLLDHNLHVLYGTIIRPAVETLAFSKRLFSSEVIGRLEYLRGEFQTNFLSTKFPYFLLFKGRNSNVLNCMLNEAMSWVDNASYQPIIVPLTSWIKPPLCPLVTSFKIDDYVPGMVTLVQPTVNYQHLIVAGYPNGRVLMYHILTNTIVKSFNGELSDKKS